ncbi:MAG TPA: galactose oxidase [Clostridia bacterium]|nr:galactose oxidase [Clostridia bacterium]
MDNKDAVSPTVVRPFKMDRKAPVLGTVTFTSATNSVTISGVATDAIAGLPTNKYQYTLSTKPVVPWTSQASQSFTGLTPNTQYTAKFEARDSVGHVSAKQQNIYTKAAVPTAAVSNPKSYTLDVSMSDTNPSATQYQIVVNTNKYVTPEGTLTTSPVWIAPSGKKITVKGLSPSTTYTFKVKAKNGDGVETALSSPVSGTTLIAPPAAPANIIATATSDTVTLSWNAAATAESYEVEADGAIKSAGTSTTYTHMGLNPGTPHTYRIRGINAGGAGSWSTIVEKSTRPSAPDIPSNLTVIPLSTSVTVTWNNVPGATGYDIMVDDVLVNNGPNTNYKHTSLTPGTSHTYRVRSINAGDKSDWSNTVTATTLVESTPVPANVSTEVLKNQIEVSWNAVDGATGYEIEADGVNIDNSTRTSYTHINLEPATDHRYRVRAKRGGTISDWSVMVTATTLTGEFGTPANLRAYAEDTSVSLTWGAVTDAIAYDVEIDGETIANGADTFCIHEGLEPDTTHTYRVRAISETETSGWSEPRTVTTFELPTPANIRTFASETSIETVWDTVYGAVYYDMEFNGTIIPDIWNTSYTCEGLRPGRQYTLSVRAKNIYGTSNWSIPINESTVYTGAEVPSVSGIARKSSITLLWNTVSGEESYDLEIDGEVMEGTSSRTYLHNNLSPGTQHTYRVRTRNGPDAGEWSSTFTAATLAETPDVPTNIAASSAMTSILVTWDQVAAAEGYEIEVDGVVLDNGTGTGYRHNDLSPDTAHTYRVRAKNLGGYSQWSDLITKVTVSSVQEYVIDCTAGEEFNLMLSAANIQDLSSYSFTVRYSSEDLEVTDLCGFTSRIDTNTGSITGTDIKVTQYEPGTIVFTKAGSAQTYEVWSGVVNSIKFKARREGQLTVTYSIN